MPAPRRRKGPPHDPKSRSIREPKAAVELRQHENASPASGADSSLQSPWVRLRSATYHPFIYRRMVAECDPAAAPGDVVNVYDKRGALFGRGLYNPRSQIAVRMLSHGDEAIDEAFWRGRLARAVELRRMLRLDEVSDAYRLVHAEGDGLSGLIAERFADCIVLEVFSLGMFQRWRDLAGALAELLGAPPARGGAGGSPVAGGWRFFVRADDRVEQLEGFRVPPPDTPAPRNLVIREHGVRYRVDIAGGQKTGFFCDQRDNRRRLAGFCRGASVLDVCCYSGGFGLCAKLLGEATEVTCVDLDEEAVALAKANVNLNQARVSVVHSDAFIYMRQMQSAARQFDVLVLDPPKLALSRDDYDEALRKYHDLNQLACRLVRPGGLLLSCSCSGLVSQEALLRVVHAAGNRAGRKLQLLEASGAAADHPVALDCPESAYLKALWLRLV